MLRKIMFTLFIAAFIAGMVFTPAQAAQPTNYRSAFQIRNLSSSPATVTITFYNSSDGSVELTLSDTVAGDATNSYTELTDAQLPGTGAPAEGFKGSVVIASNQAVASMSNIVGLDAAGAAISFASYGAFSSGSATVSLPLLMKDNYGFDTFFAVQNTGAADAVVTAKFSDGSADVVSPAIKPGASYTFDQNVETHAAAVFSATLTTSASTIAATVVEVGPTTLFSYSGFGAGSTELVFPLVNQQPQYNYFSGVQIQNTGDTASDVTVSYTPSIAGTACTEVRTIAGKGSVTFSQYVFTTFPEPAASAATLKSTNCVKGERFVGSARVTTNTATMPLVGVVNQLNNVDNKGAAYSAMSPASGNRRVVYPLIMDRNYGFWTSWSIVNVSPTATIAKADLVCTVTGKDISGAAVTKTFSPDTDLAPFQGWTLNHINQIADRFVGGATCQGPAGALLVGSANQLNQTSAVAGTPIDSLLVYEGFAVAAP